MCTGSGQGGMSTGGSGYGVPGMQPMNQGYGTMTHGPSSPGMPQGGYMQQNFQGYQPQYSQLMGLLSNYFNRPQFGQQQPQGYATTMTHGPAGSPGMDLR